MGSPIDTILLPPLDITGNPRVSNLRVDMGVYELQVNSPTNLIEESVLVFPNPSTEFLEINYDLDLNASYRILSVAGHEVNGETKIISSRVYIEGLERGAYILEIKNGILGFKYLRFIKF